MLIFQGVNMMVSKRHLLFQVPILGFCLENFRGVCQRCGWNLTTISTLNFLKLYQDISKGWCRNTKGVPRWHPFTIYLAPLGRSYIHARMTSKWACQHKRQRLKFTTRHKRLTGLAYIPIYQLILSNSDTSANYIKLPPRLPKHLVKGLIAVPSPPKKLT